MSAAGHESDIAGDLHELVTGGVCRGDRHEVAVFKSVGLAFEDVVVAPAILRAARAERLGR